jgi:hypothetical protein
MDRSLQEKILNNLFPSSHAAVEPWNKFKWHLRGSECDTWQLNSSQALAIDLFGTLKVAGRPLRDGVLAALAKKAGLPEDGPWNVDLEWEDEDNRLKESGKCTQVDALATSPSAIICFEAKFGEEDGGVCSQPKPIKNGPNKGKIQCSGRYEMQLNPVNRKSGRCALSAKGIRYWDVIPQVFDISSEVDHRPCPFAGPWYQWMRNLVLAHELGISHRKQSAFIVIYADHPALPFPQVLRSKEWTAFTGCLRPDSVRMTTLAYESILKESVVETEQKSWSDLQDWITTKIHKVGNNC